MDHPDYNFLAVITVKMIMTFSQLVTFYKNRYLFEWCMDIFFMV